MTWTSTKLGKVARHCAIQWHYHWFRRAHRRGDVDSMLDRLRRMLDTAGCPKATG